MASIENSLKYESEVGGARRHPSSDIATQCSLRSGDTAEPGGANPPGESQADLDFGSPGRLAPPFASPHPRTNYSMTGGMR